LEHPSAERLLALRDLILERSDFAPYSPEWQVLGELHGAGEFGRVLGAWELLQPVGVLSPRLHFWAGTAALELGEYEQAAWERHCMQACLQGLLQTGTGAAESPFIVTYRWDAYDVMRALGASPAQQSLIDTEYGLCDRFLCDDGEDYWFLVGELVDRANQRCAGLLRRYLRPAVARNS
jgi:hypothetical protein